MNTYGYRWRVIIILLSVLYPFFCMINSGIKPSLSEYWNTGAQPIFIFGNIITAHYFVQFPKWALSGVLLLVVTAISTQMYPNMHNITAIFFFTSAFIPLIKSKRFKFLIPIYLLGAFIMFLKNHYVHSLLIGEIICILTIGTHHLLLLQKLKSITYDNNN